MISSHRGRVLTTEVRMPTYEYRCRSCGQDTEVVQSFADPPLTECPKCGGELRKVFAPVGIVFYKTDNRSGRSRAAASKDSKEKEPAAKEPAKESSSAASGASTSDSKI